MRKTPLYYLLRNWHVKRTQAKGLAGWEIEGRPVPIPHIVKQRILQDHAKRFELKVLVETGTYYGDMVEAMKDSFDRIYSIELSENLYKKALGRFKRAKQIELIHGDSGIKLRDVINKINQPALFWLDGHYSDVSSACGDKQTPIYEELGHILNAPDRGDVIIIDDARCFGADPAYPTIEKLSDFIRSKRPNINIVVQDDSIRITPKQ